MNLLEDTPKPKKISKKKIIKLGIYLSAFLFIGFIIFTSQVLVSNQNNGSWLSKMPLFSQIKNLAESADKKLKGEDRERVNILLLGMGGRNHEGGLLTDTIMLASLDTNEQKAALISIPRDMSIPVEDKGWQKINAVNAYAEMENYGSGGLAVSQALGDLLNTPIDYYLRIDFQGFSDIIDRIGGIKVYVENTLDDYSYPVAGRETDEDYASRYEHLHVDKGWQAMDGALALKYARSRHAAGVEGSDFARSRRQQKIIEAVKNKMLSADTLLNPKKVMGILDDLSDNVSTNIKVWEAVKLWSSFKDIESGAITNKVLDNSPNGLLIDKISDQGAYILVPRNGDFSEIEYLVNNIFSEAPIEQKNAVTEEMATLEVRNGTWINGLASKVALDFEKYGFEVVRIGNSSRQNFQKSVIYDLTYGEKVKSLEIIKNILEANVAFGLPEWLLEDLESELDKEASPTQPDFILILGQDADVSGSGALNDEE